MIAPSLHIEEHFLSEPQELFQILKQSVVWDESMKARKTASFGVSYNYSQITYPETPMPEDIQAIVRSLKTYSIFTEQLSSQLL